MSVGKLPDEWRRAVVTPLAKGGSPNDVTNYRPISLTSAVCKLMERVIVNEMLDFLRLHGAISKDQHGFLAGKSTTSNLLEALNDWTLAIDNRCGVNIAYIDYAKAFDSVSHHKLCHKLASYGICGNLLDWIRSFLTNRQQCTRVGGAYF
jgi:hypothetical protein